MLTWGQRCSRPGNGSRGIMSTEVYLSLGSNLGDREENIKQALAQLAAQTGVEVVKHSGLYESEPLYLRNQPWFLNCVIQLRTQLEVDRLLRLCQGIERHLGRKKGIRYGPRVIDIDILFYGQKVVRESNLQIPHPRLQERRFVLEPLCELNPQWEHPLLKKNIKQLLDEVGEGQKIRYFKTLSME